MAAKSKGSELKYRDSVARHLSSTGLLEACEARLKEYQALNVAPGEQRKIELQIKKIKGEV